MTFDPSNDLSAEARALLDAASDGDVPTAADRVRIRAGVARRLAIGVAAGAVVATTAKSVVAGAAVATGSAASASTGAGVVGASAATSLAGGSAGGTVAAGASAAATGTAVAAGSSALGGGALTFGIAGAGTKILAAIAIAGVVGAGTMTYRQTRSTESAQATTSSIAMRSTDRNEAIASPPSHRGAVAPVVAPPNPQQAASPAAASAPSPAIAPVASAVPHADLDRAPASKGAASLNTGNANAAPLASAASGADSPGDLVAELALLRDAHAALRDGDGSRALAILADHARRFPGGALTEEREASRVLALCNVGRIDEARDAASRFLREHPRSPQAARVAHACDGDTTF